MMSKKFLLPGCDFYWGINRQSITILDKELKLRIVVMVQYAHTGKESREREIPAPFTQKEKRNKNLIKKVAGKKCLITLTGLSA